MFRKTTIALAVALMLGGSFIATDAFAKGGGGHGGGGHGGGGHGGGGHGGGFHGVTVVAVTEVVDMVVDMEATTVRVTALVPAFRYRCPLLVAGKLVAKAVKADTGRALVKAASIESKGINYEQGLEVTHEVEEHCLLERLLGARRL